MKTIPFSVTQAIQSLKAGSLTSTEWSTISLERIHNLNRKLNAFLEVASESARAAAEESDRLLTECRLSGEEPAPLQGVPVAIKDVLCVKGMPCTCGSKILEGFRPPFNATAVEKLLQAGAVLLGKTNTDEFAMGSSTENSAFGISRNPWNTQRVPGGSSGGSAAAVAAGMAPIALGTDTGGSVRQPAAFCGVTGLKPSYGRISRYGLIAYGSSLDCIGVLARTAADTARLLQVMAGYDPLDSTSLREPVPDYEKVIGLPSDLKGLRIGIPREYFLPGMQAEVEREVRKAIDHLATLGAQIMDISLPHTEFALPVYYLVAPAEASANLARYDGIRYGVRASEDALWASYDKTRGTGFGPEVKRRIMLGTYALSAGYYDAYYGQAQKVRTLIKADFESAFRQVDLIASPVAPHTAFSIGEKTEDPLSMYLEDIFTLPANLAGIPAISIPCGFDGARMPIGLQLTGPFLGEAVLLRAADAFQQTTNWHKESPSI